MEKKFRLALCLHSLLLTCSMLNTAHASDVAPAPKEQPSSNAERKRALPKHFAAIGSPAWAVEARVVPDEARELVAVSRAGYHGFVKSLLANGALANAPDERGQRPLIAAVTGGHAEIVRLLLAAGASPNVKGPEGRWPLSIAAATGQDGVVRQLLQAGADVNVRSDNGASALHDAIRFRQSEVIPLLLAAEPYRENYDTEGLHPLALAASLGNLNALQTLLKAGVDPDQPDRDGRTALYWARRHLHVLAEAYLLDHGATRDTWPIAVD